MKRKFILASAIALSVLLGAISCSKDDETDQQEQSTEQTDTTGTKDSDGSDAKDTDGSDAKDSDSTSTGADTTSQQPEVKMFTVTLPDGTTQQVEEGKTFTLPAADAAFSKEVYKSGDTEYTPGQEVTVTEDMVFTLSQYYKVTFSDGAEEYVEAGTEYVLPACTEQYKAYTYAIGETSYNAGDKVKVDKDITVTRTSYDVVTMKEFPDYIKGKSEATVTISDYDPYSEDTVYVTSELKHPENWDLRVNLILPASDKLTSLPDAAFLECRVLQSIILPEGITSFGDDVFGECVNLTSISIPSTVTSMGDYCFYGCSSLPSISFGPNVTSVGIRAFDQCSSLETATIFYIDTKPELGYCCFPSSTEISYWKAATIKTGL